MSGEVIQGPWGGAPVEQNPPRLTQSRWWERLDDGSLLVLCHGARTHGERYQVAPIAEWHPVDGGSRTNVIPPRSPNGDRITVALDRVGLYGPEVDEALGVADAFDTVVDGWEAGTLIPSESEIRRLCMLTGMLPAWFYDGTLPDASWMHICTRSAFKHFG